MVVVQQDFFYSSFQVRVLANFLLTPKNSLGMQGLERRSLSFPAMLISLPRPGLRCYK